MVKGAVRPCKRKRLEDLAGELEQAISRNQVRGTVKRLAPVLAPPRVTARQKVGPPTWDHNGEIDARRDALVTILEAEPLLLNTEPQSPKPSTGYLLRRKTPSGQLHNCQTERLDRAFAAGALQTEVGVGELLRSFGRQWSDNARRLHCRYVPSLFLEHGRSQRSQAASHRKTKIRRLRSYANQAKTLEMQKNWRTIVLITLARLGLKYLFTGADSSKGCRSMSSHGHPGKCVREIH